MTDVAFVDALADPIGTAATILAAVDLELTDDAVVAMEAWIAQDAKRETLPVHRYTAGRLRTHRGADPGAVRRLHDALSLVRGCPDA